MADGALRVLCVHGVNTPDLDPIWQGQWHDAIRAGVARWSPSRPVVTKFLAYNDLFAGAPITGLGVGEAALRLGWSGLVHGVGDLLRRRGLLDLPELIRWTAGMIVQWVENEALRAALRRRLAAAVRREDPDLVVAHSLGSLICYDTFLRADSAALTRGRTFVSFGSQIGNPFVRNVFGGRLVSPDVARWFHLYNANDRLFTGPIRLADERFEQVEVTFAAPDGLDHDAPGYLAHANVTNTVWLAAAGGARARALARKAGGFTRAVQRARRAPRRALLVGINEYANPADRLEGCVNDVFLMSSVLQECGFAAGDIRVILDDRATSGAVLERLEWLLDGTGPGDQRVFYYSGHGAQIPAYGATLETDRYEECLVTHDFAWSADTAVTDDRLYELYSQLPYEAWFVAMLDCCHSGGMTRDGGLRVRGLDPPDDIRHRALTWNARVGMWEARKLADLNPDLGDRAARRDFLGRSGAARKLGRAMPLRGLGRREYDRVRKALGHHGPYMPVILEACQESEYAYEYRHGATAYGAFTYSLAEALRRMGRAGRRPSFRRLVEEATRTLGGLGYTQHPVLVGPSTVVSQPVPWQGARARRRVAAARRRRRK